ncbi:carbohydrate ABC transporter permease [Pseudogracilibacillus sp. SO30301A]|uniref:carbohydrate ABC transporter permease n=1 Tax=Pseudogracilibacillus sp. SO30301A TaxID=3098291 RepID=UPI00300E43F4
MNKIKRKKKYLLFALLIIMLLFILLPIYWMLSTSIKPNTESFKVPPEIIPTTPTLENFINQLKDRTGFLTYFVNSIIVSLGTTILSIITAILAGYAISRLRFPGKDKLFILILVSQMFPQSLMIVGIYTFFMKLNLLDSYLGLILAFTSFSLPFAIWMMSGFFETIPFELEEAAMIDGSSRFKTLWKVILPLTSPGIVAVGVYSFLNSWNNLLFALSLTSSQDMRTVPPGFLLTYVGEFQYYWSDAMAGSIIITLPMVAVFILLQRYLVQGMTAGAVK